MRLRVQTLLSSRTGLCGPNCLDSHGIEATALRLAMWAELTFDLKFWFSFNLARRWYLLDNSCTAKSYRIFDRQFEFELVIAFSSIGNV
jgi:hypothetical protein